MNRLLLHNVGLSNAIDGPVRFRMYAVINIVEGLSDAQKRNNIKSNIFGVGYENGKKTSIGCSYKGKIWSKKRINILEWCKWCDSVGEKLKNNEIDIDNLLEGVLKPKRIEKRPDLMPVSIEWPEYIYINYINRTSIVYDDIEVPLYEVSIELVDANTSGNLKFKLSSKYFSIVFELIFEEEENYKYKQFDDLSTKIKIGNSEIDIIEWFEEEPPVIRFVDGSYIQNNYFIEIEDYDSFNRDKIMVWDWEGVDITKESQNLIVDDDNAGKLLI